ncbi:MAG TPA: tRNA (adenosine(37)-N6)-threonylcarbamoyltransferase complex transferase subunit TsaD [bacterium]|nr:tRNA (adenosine(37)-N6)-threonylcarbamoyltransferase complex transferase subunit TsaD [bacterium]
MLTLGIESSCDETAASVVSGGRVLSSLVATQHDVHARFGGVVPELASRRHLENVVPLVSGALSEASVSLADIEGVAVTSAPGLVGSLLVGISAAKGIAYSRNIPLVGVNHLEGHLNAAALEFGEIPLPYVGLVVSGGHTSLYLVKGFGDYKLLGATRDDAAGEAFDKVAKLLGLGYPGGPAIDKVAENGDPKAFRFTSPRFADENSLDFSFSGIKTAVLLTYRKEAGIRDSGTGARGSNLVSDLAASFQESVVRIITERVIEAARRTGAKAVVLSGGVAANRRLRARLKEAAEAANLTPFIPQMSFCTDNAAMIAYVGEKHLMAGKRSDFTLNATASQEIGL